MVPARLYTLYPPLGIGVGYFVIGGLLLSFAEQMGCNVHVASTERQLLKVGALRLEGQGRSWLFYF